MAKQIATGVVKKATITKDPEVKQLEQLSLQWRDFRNKIDSILLTTNTLKSTEIRQKCLALDSMSQAERERHITEHWGPLYLNKVSPLLAQILTLEEKIKELEEKRKA